MTREWQTSRIPAAWYRGRRVSTMTCFYTLVHGENYGRRMAIVEFHCGSARAVPFEDIEVEVVYEAVAS